MMKKIVNSIRNLYLGEVGSSLNKVSKGSIIDRMANTLDDDKEV